MPLEDLQALRRRGEGLEPGEDALAAYEEIFELDPDDSGAAVMIGRSLQELGRHHEARDHWTLVVELQPGNDIARRRLESLKHRPRSTTAARSAAVPGPRRPPAQIVEPILAGPGRGSCLRFLATSIRMTERIAPGRLAVTDRPSDGRFRVSGGKGSGVTPWKGLLCVFVHQPAVTPELEAAIRAADGRIVFEAGGLKSLPESVEYGIPFERFEAVAQLIEHAHREHLLRSIEAGPAPWGHMHDPTLRDYIVDQAGVTA